jgi:hypothetical protein
VASSLLRRASPPDTHIERPIATMALPGGFVAQNKAAHDRICQPMRNKATQYPAFFAARIESAALSCDDQHQFPTLVMGAVDGIQQHPVCLGLSHAMQVDPGIKAHHAARDVAAGPAIKRGERG